MATIKSWTEWMTLCYKHIDVSNTPNVDRISAGSTAALSLPLRYILHSRGLCLRTPSNCSYPPQNNNLCIFHSFDSCLIWLLLNHWLLFNSVKNVWLAHVWPERKLACMIRGWTHNDCIVWRFRGHHDVWATWRTEPLRHPGSWILTLVYFNP